MVIMHVTKVFVTGEHYVYSYHGGICFSRVMEREFRDVQLRSYVDLAN